MNKTIRLIILLVLLHTANALAATPADMLAKKGFSKPWIDALTEPGEPRWYTGEELQFIGQPVGGLYAGQIYLGGDGRLWYWDIFNNKITGFGGGGDRFYNNPMQPDRFRAVSSGFFLDLGNRAVPLDARGFTKTRFRGEYPIARVQMEDPGVPLRVELETFSPFCPTDSRNSSIPATLMCYTFTNTSKKSIPFRVGGWLENATSRRAIKKQGKLKHITTPIHDTAGLLLTAKSTDGSPIKPDADTGSMALALLGKKGFAIKPDTLPAHWKTALEQMNDRIPANAAVMRSELLTLQPGKSLEIRFAVCWHFPNGQLGSLFSEVSTNHAALRNHYAKFYPDAAAVAQDLSKRHDALAKRTRLWRDTWYDSTLPTWFLDRTFVNTSTLASTACIRLHDTKDPALDGRVYFWEGIYLGIGTCTHVTHYEQAFGRLFPDAARAQRSITDYNIGWNDKLGFIQYRAENEGGHHFGIPHAIDGHAGTILRTYREHTTSEDDAFLRSVWPRVKRATKFMIDQDAGRSFFEQHVPAADRNMSPDGILSGPQYNTLDKVWDGILPWTSGLYLASLRATAEMAADMGDAAFAKECTSIADAGTSNLSKATFNKKFGYFVQHPNQQAKYVNVNNGCHIDQLLGDYWTYQAGLKPVFPKDEARSALKKVFEYNFHKKIGNYRDQALIKVQRFYADNDEPGTVLCAFPHGGADKSAPAGGGNWDALVVGYFSECMTGFTYQSAADMISQDLVLEGLALSRAIHDRYAESPKRRNPFNEIEYGNHYTRAMASYGVYISMCGFQYHGPKARICFAPKMQTGHFKAAFTTAKGWGSFSQERRQGRQLNTLEIKYGSLDLSEISLKVKGNKKRKVRLTINGKENPIETSNRGSHYRIRFEKTTLQAGDEIKITLK